MFIAPLINRLRAASQAVAGGWRWSRKRKADVAHLDDVLGILKRDAPLNAAIHEELREAARMGKPWRSSVDVAEVIRTTIGVLRPVAAHSGIRLVARCAATSVIVPGDPADVTHIVSRVLVFAIASGERGDTVDCEVSVNGDWLMVHIAVQRSRTEAASAALGPSTAGDPALETEVWADLGFAAVRELVELHGGVVHVEIDQRSRRPLFAVWLPGEGRTGNRKRSTP